MPTGYDLLISAATRIGEITGDPYPARFVEFHRQAFERYDLRNMKRRNMFRKLLQVRYDEGGNQTQVDLKNQIELALALLLRHPIEQCRLRSVPRTVQQEGRAFVHALKLIVLADDTPRKRHFDELPKRLFPVLVSNFLELCLLLLPAEAYTLTPQWSDAPEPALISNLRLIIDEAAPLMVKGLPPESATIALGVIIRQVANHRLTREELLSIVWLTMAEIRKGPSG